MYLLKHEYNKKPVQNLNMFWKWFNYFFFRGIQKSSVSNGYAHVLRCEIEHKEHNFTPNRYAVRLLRKKTPLVQVSSTKNNNHKPKSFYIYEHVHNYARTGKHSNLLRRSMAFLPLLKTKTFASMFFKNKKKIFHFF